MVPNPDYRSDEEILTDLQALRPVEPASERNIWAFWDRGLFACKPWCQRNIISWVRRHGSSWTVRILDMVDGSPTHYSNYIPNNHTFFPDSFLKHKMTGTHTAPHAADLIRLPLLYLYGGVWIDIGMMLFRGLDDLCWNRLQDPTNTLEMAGFKITMTPDVGMFWNGFIAARKGCIAIKYWHDTFLKCWEGKVSTAGMGEHPLLCHLPRYEMPSSTEQAPAFEYSEFVDYLAQMFCLERLRHVRDPVLDWDGPAFFAQKVLLYECATEVYWAQQLTEWDGRKQFNLLSHLREGVEQNESYREANAFVSDILRTSSMMKLSHGILTEQREYLARIWDLPENSDADVMPGTFASYLRSASMSYQQTRRLHPVSLAVRKEALLIGSLFEVVGDRHCCEC